MEDASLKPFVAAVDWGTTRLRIWIMDETGTVLSERRADEGLLATGPGAFAETLERHLGELGVAPSLPAVICGMAGSRQGWVEAPYRPLPASLAVSAADAVTVRCSPRPVFILPGLARQDVDFPDVMRGEETQIAGAAAAFGDRRVTACMPGTHSKWVDVEAGLVVAGRTFMTGELFALLAGQSILRHSLGQARVEIEPDDPTFREWCARAIAIPEELTARLFQIRAAGLLSGMSAGDAEAALSGLLIGSEVGAARSADMDAVVLIASGTVGRLYEAALELGGLAVTRVDAEEAVRSGLMAAARGILLGSEGRPS